MKHYPEIRTERGRRNKEYMIRAMHVLGWGKGLAWFGLESRQKAEAGGGRDLIKQTVLSELGRFSNDNALKVAAIEILHAQPTTDRMAVKMLRQMRLSGRIGAEGMGAFANNVYDYIRKKFAEDRSLDWEDVHDALAAVINSLPKRSRSDEDDSYTGVQ